MEIDAERAITIHEAVQDGDFNMASHLVNTGSSVNTFDHEGFTPLHYAVLKKDVEMIIHLAELGAEINAGTRDKGQSPAYVAAEMGNVGCLEALLRCGAVLTFRDDTVEGNKTIHAAVQHSRIDATIWLLRNGVSVNSRNRKGETPLFCAIDKQDLCLVVTLLERGADVNIRCIRRSNGITPLHLAVSHGQFLTVRFLLMNGADMSLACDINNETPAHWAARQGNVDMLQLMCEYGNILSMETDNEAGNHAIHVAVREGHLPLVKWLVSKGVSVNCRSRNGHSPLHTAAYLHRYDIALYLLQEGSQVHARTKSPQLNSPLDLAMKSGNSDMADLLIHYGAKVNAADHLYGFTALHHAVVSDNLDCLKHLVQKGGNIMVSVDGGKGEPLILTAVRHGAVNVGRWLLETEVLVNTKFKSGQTALHLAANLGTREMALLLLRSGADIDCRDDKHRTPLHYAAFAGHVDVLALLISRKADTKVEALFGCTALHIAAMNNQIHCVQLLTLLGDDVMQPTRLGNGDCVLHIAAVCGYEVMARWLINRDVQIDVRNKIGMTALMTAALHGHSAVAKLLLDKGANVNSKQYTLDNATALHFACAKKNAAMVKFLIENGADVNARTRVYATPPLHWAAIYDCQPAVELLIRYGADINTKDLNGLTAADWAARKGYRNIYSVLTNRQTNTS